MEMSTGDQAREGILVYIVSVLPLIPLTVLIVMRVDSGGVDYQCSLIPYLLVQAYQSDFACCTLRPIRLVQRLLLHGIVSLAD
jgi:hypothetical protein